MNTNDLEIFSELLRKVDRIADNQIITNERLEQIENSLSSQGQRFERIENILVDNSKIMMRMLDRVESVEATLGKVSDALGRLIEMSESLSHLDQRVMQLENAKLLQRLTRLENIIFKE
ncbi:MAG: hypothetical protein EAZ08_02190 [Cytophagales bacterium]|nr:MAG: hypothetical protein EAZ08_02190 [Cytophagales bacterium]